jgi:tRNA-specific adenosine deaminase 1
MELQSAVFSTVIEFYNRFPVSSKIRNDEYTVLAAIVAQVPTGPGTTGSFNLRIVSMATGTKCIGRGVDNCNGCLLCDSHAEVVCKRSFQRYLHEHVAACLRHPSSGQNDTCPITFSDGAAIPFELKAGWKFHLYISDSPCGEASLYETTMPLGVSGVNPTGAKLVRVSTTEKPIEPSPNPPSSTETNASITNNQNSPFIGSLRTKSGRSDIRTEDRTASKSCSDKVCRWCCVGLQGYVSLA